MKMDLDTYWVIHHIKSYFLRVLVLVQTSHFCLCPFKRYMPNHGLRLSIFMEIGNMVISLILGDGQVALFLPHMCLDLSP